MTHAIEVELQYGLPAGGRRHRVVELREPNGHDEAMLAAMAGEPPSRQASALVQALILSAGDGGKPSLDDVRGLTVGDRERILFYTAARLLGPEIDLVAACPTCRELSEVEVRFADLAALDVLPQAERVRLASVAGDWSAEIRPATCGDVDLALAQETRPVRSLLLGCLLHLDDPHGNRVAPETLPAECEAALASALAASDPAAERSVAIECPACEAGFAAVADGFTIVRTGFAEPDRFYETIYRMAHNYHWSEAEILALPLARRRHYLAIAEGAEAAP